MKYFRWQLQRRFFNDYPSDSYLSLGEEGIQIFLVNGTNKAVLESDLLRNCFSKNVSMKQWDSLIPHASPTKLLRY